MEERKSYDKNKLGILDDKCNFHVCGRCEHEELAHHLIEKFKLNNGRYYGYGMDLLQKYGFVSVHFQDGEYWFNYDSKTIKEKSMIWIIENYKGLIDEAAITFFSGADQYELYGVLHHFIEKDYLIKKEIKE